ncbi:TPR-like protein [Scenedesmus sp. NREL 46B-D3]|nr:TPR-like protein [Scenedesmus sp. NREL 46B-D3]
MSVEGSAGASGDVRLPKAMKVKSKQPAQRQITAEQILREAKEIQLEDDFKAPKTIITDPQELAEYRLRKRKEFEDTARRVGRWNHSIWIKYAHWEESQKDFRRARSVWERALDVDYTDTNFWLKYAEMEMRHRFVNHARNVWDRAVSLLPRIDQLWYKYIHMEEMVKETAKARLIFDRWMAFEPDHASWMAYIKFELRYDEVDRARAVFERYVEVLPSVKAWVRYAKFELQHNDVARARSCYERAMEALGEDSHMEEFFLRFAEFEEMVKEHERARAIFQYALDHLPKGAAQELYTRFVAFEKQHGSREGIEDVVLSKRRFTYEQEIAKNPLNYDAWFDYVKLEESTGNHDRIREVYERAVANLPPGDEKRFWQRYIYLWIKYALFEELDAGDMEKAREVYRTALKLVPHGSFTFAKLWLLAAKLEVRAKRLPAARKILGLALGSCPKGKLFKEYIQLEMTLGNIDRCRTLYEKYLEWNPANATAWLKYAELEVMLSEAGRARALYELAISQPALDMPEALWKAYIDFEMAQGNRDRTRLLYERLLDRTKHVKVWLSFAKFEAEALPQPEQGEQEGEEAQPRQTPPGEGSSAAERGARAVRARGVFERGLRAVREGAPDAKEEAVMLLEAWRDFEAACSDFRRRDEVAAAVTAVERKMPRRIKRKRAITNEAGLASGMEEYYDYVFPEEAGAAPNLKLLEAAMRWKRQKMAGGGDKGEGGAGGDSADGNGQQEDGQQADEGQQQREREEEGQEEEDY